MLIASKQIVGCSLQGDGDSIGKVKDILFDEETWDVRYLDIDTGGWLYDRRVILSTATIHAADYVVQQLGTKLSREQVDKSPPLESDLPVSRRKEIELAKYYSWGAYWAALKETSGSVETEGDPHLRSVRAVTGYRVEATDGDIGHIDDFIVDDGDLRTAPWGIRYLVIDTRNWLPGRRVLIPPLWTDAIDWDTRRIRLDLARETIKEGPEYDPNMPVNRQYEEVFYDYYGQPYYWRQSVPTG